ncbi:MAG: sensor domain-containing diguanylate cyclase [Candidatus Lernaella stagnicola]|nr:sensor domain-containing diguanylate cyclase [Candidatus Lernaella stagnicola]
MNAAEFYRGFLLNNGRLVVLAMDPNLQIVEAGQGCVQALGYPTEELVGRNLYEFLVAESRDATYQLTDVDHFANETITLRTADGRKTPLLASFFRDDKGVVLVGEVLDLDVKNRDALLEMHKKSFSLAKEIEELRQRNENLDMVNHWLREKAVTDPHTGLYKRNHLDRLLKAEWERAKRYMADLSFMLTGIDGLRAFREVQGDDAATRVMRGVSRVLDGRKRLFDILGHFDNETFFLILPHTNAKGAREFGERLLQMLHNREIRAGGYPFHIFLSIGTASYHNRNLPLKSHEELIHASVDFLGQAQLAGGNQVFSRQSPPTKLRVANP